MPEPKLCLSTTNSICIFIDDEKEDEDELAMSGPEMDASIARVCHHFRYAAVGHPGLAALHRVLPYVAELLAASAGAVSDMAMHAAGVYTFQSSSIDLCLATLDDFCAKYAADKR
ncbi:hypothetical protein GGF32_001793 [Allomyces javanicus]|nr:hypothetical protein GGF32_001793 [Allomyces javanicus]